MNSTKPLYIYGHHTVRAILDTQPHKIRTLYILQNRQDQKMQAIINLARQKNITIEQVPHATLTQLVGAHATHQGVVASIQTPQPQTEKDLERLLSQLQEPAFLLILDNVQDPHNLGACLRIADAAGIHAVIAPKSHAAGLTTTVYKTASGATETIPYVQVANLARTIRMLQKHGIWLIGADADADEPLYQADYTVPIAIVVGAEGTGLRRLTKEHCDYLYQIPMAGRVASLNVSVAAGVFAFEAVRQRSAAKVSG